MTAFGNGTPITSNALNTAFAELEAMILSGVAAAGSLTGTTLASNVIYSSLTSVGTITSGTWSGSFGSVSGANLTTLNASNLSSGTVASARISGSYTGITGVGTLTAGSIPSSLITGLATSATTDTTNASNISSGTLASARISGSYTGITSVGTLGSLTVDGVNSPSLTIGDWNTNGAYGSIYGTRGYVLLSHATDTGIYLRANSAGSVVYIGGNGTDQLIVSQTQSQFTGGSNTAPSITFQGDTNTGMYSNTADYVLFACGGTNMVTFTTSGAFFATNTTTSTTTWRVDTFNRLATPSSSRALKENISDLSGNSALSIIRALRPRTFTWKPQEDDSEFLTLLKPTATQAGFIVEEIAETELPFSMLEYKPDINDSMSESQKIERAKDLANYVPYYWKESHLIAILTSAVKELDSRLTTLENT